jgi:hypothetical protein
MTEHLDSRRAAASGAVFVLLLFGALFAPGPPPRASDSAASIAQALSDDRGVILGGMWVAGIALIFGLWFFSVVGIWLAHARRDTERVLACAATVGGVAAVLLILIGMLFFYGASYQVAGAKELAVVRGLSDAGNAAIELSKFGVTLFVTATSVVGLRLSSMPRPLARAGLASAAISLVSSVPLFAEGPFTEFGGGLDLLGAAPATLWILCLSVWMNRPTRNSMT